MKIGINSNRIKAQQGFTLMEIMVATTIFAVVTVSMLSLFNYVLKINRRSQALSQASEGMRNFVEFLVKQIENGQIDYDVVNGLTYTSWVDPCGPPVRTVNAAVTGASTYAAKENKLGIINTDNVQECFYYGKADGSYVDVVGGAPSTFSSSTGGSTLVLTETGVAGAQILNPPNFKVDNLMFLIHPQCDPYTPNCTSYSNSFPKIQPSVTIIIKFITSLPTGEQVPIYYQTTVSSNKYDIPNH